MSDERLLGDFATVAAFLPSTEREVMTDKQKCSDEAEDIIARYGGAQFLAGQCQGSEAGARYSRSVDETRDELETFIGKLEKEASR